MIPVMLAKRNSEANDARFRIICVPIAMEMDSGPNSVA